MAEFEVTIKAIISVDDPQALDGLIIARLCEDKDVEIVSTEDDDFKVVEYPDDWLGFTEVMRVENDVDNTGEKNE
tara:strand:+ start:651 stop:875 length:225 start_codon:yes stop_codon:yes gene_type:complete